ncbi:MAG: hypothetical protein U0K54_07105 [Acutalibacteraceae bacterium]|nr:hypothetical protein [Acutalibacteraceae bacterium]
MKKAVKTTYKKPKNVIIMIADGMGPNDIKVCQKFSTYQFKYVCPSPICQIAVMQ